MLKLSGLLRILLVCISIIVLDSPLQGCSPGTNSGNNSKSGSKNSNTSGITISGTINIAQGSIADSDVNDPNADYKSNDTLSTAQNILNPTTLGGYVNIAQHGQDGRSFATGDTDDYYLVQLSAGESVSINNADFDVTASNSSNQIVLYLLDQAGTVLQATTGSQATEIININNDGIYYLRVMAVSGASKYVITIGLTGQIQVNSSNSIDTSADFVPGEVIVEYNPVNSTTNTASNVNVTGVINTLSNASGLLYKAGAPDRTMLMGLQEGNSTSSTLSVLGIKSVPKASNPTLQKKLDTIEVVKALRQRNDVLSARLNYIRKPLAVPDDQYYKYQWDFPAIKLPQAWDMTMGSNDVIVAVIDTGVLLNHPDLQGQLVAGYDFIRDPTNARDGNGIDSNPDDVGDSNDGHSSFHGTHVSGTIAAASNNGLGVAGIASGIKIMPLRVLGVNGGTEYDIEQAIRFAAQLPNDSNTIPPQKADVINMSLGGPTASTTPPKVFTQARAQGVIIVAAAGNDSNSKLNYPASLDGVVSVSATTSSSKLASYSNFGTTIDVAAPGGSTSDVNGDGYPDEILSTVGSDSSGSIVFGYGFYMGTSMASPHVAGVVALMRSVNKSLTPDQFDQLLVAGKLTDYLQGQTGWNQQFGNGQIDAFKAVTAALDLVQTPPPPPPPLAVVQPTALNFGPTTNSLDIMISNAGGGTLDVTQITENSGGWLSISASNVDVHDLGQYTVTVDRSQLAQVTQAYMATISVTTTSNTLNIPALMQVYVKNDENAGFQYVLLKDSLTEQTIQKVNATRVNGSYQYKFENVLPGSYTIRAGTDADNDGVICENAEACGVYSLPTNVVPIVVNAQSNNMSNIDFDTGFDSILSGTSFPLLNSTSTGLLY